MKNLLKLKKKKYGLNDRIVSGEMFGFTINELIFSEPTFLQCGIEAGDFTLSLEAQKELAKRVKAEMRKYTFEYEYSI